MTGDEAQKMALQIQAAAGRGIRVEIEQDGGEFARPKAPYCLWLWRVNPATGTMTPTRIDDYSADADEIGRIVAGAKRKADLCDAEARRRRAVDKEMDRE